jgi:flagellar protein FlgJ
MHARSVADVYLDFQGIAELKARARQDQDPSLKDASLKEVSRQFESLFMHMMLKSMRQASLGEGLLDNDQSLFYRDMFDQQLALHLAEGGGLGLAEIIERQLGAAQAVGDQPMKSLADYRGQVAEIAARRAATVRSNTAQTPPTTVPEPPAEDPTGSDPAAWTAEDFVHNLWPWAKEAADKLGLSAQALIAQAALETGWGKHLIRLPDGSPSHNLFGIKADQGWEGKRVAVDTLEYEQGVVARKTAPFRAYDSFRDSFSDYVEFLNSNPRYREALAATADSRNYFSALQEAGYATDPRYAEKVSGVLEGPQMAKVLARISDQADRKN